MIQIFVKERVYMTAGVILFYYIFSLFLGKSHEYGIANFSTICWFLTLHCHHLSLLPAIQKYHRRLRAIRDLQKVLDETVAAEPQWRNTPYASRNKQFVKRWRQQLKKLNKWVTYTVFIVHQVFVCKQTHVYRMTCTCVYSFKDVVCITSYYKIRLYLFVKNRFWKW